MAKAVKQKSGNWRCRAFAGTDENGKKKFKSFTAPTKKEAEFLAAQFALEKKEISKSQLTIGQAIDKYIEIKENILSPTTISGYKGIRRNYFKQLMDIPVDDLEQEMVQKAVNDEAKRGLSAKSIKSAHSLLTATLSIYRPQFKLSTTLPRIQKKFKDLPTPEEVLQATSGTDIELPVLLGLWLGMRMSEIRGVRKKDISNDGYLTIQNVVVTVDREEISKEQTKTNESTRKLKLPPEILRLIQELNIVDEEEYIIKKTRSAIYKRFIRVTQQAGLKYMTFHDLRHLNASVMLMLGISDKYAMERGGWSTPNILKSVYQHTFTSERNAVDKRIDDYFTTIMPQKNSEK